MKFRYAGKYTDESQLGRRPDPEGFVPFREPQDLKKFSMIANGLAIVLIVIFLILVKLRSHGADFNLIGIILSLVCMVPHEFLHAIWFREDVTMYNGLSQGLLFVYGTEDMTKARFVIMSLCPNIVLGLIPFVIFMFVPSLTLLGTLGAVSLGAGMGDYINIFNCLTQVPKGALVYMNGLHTYWYNK